MTQRHFGLGLAEDHVASELGVTRLHEDKKACCALGLLTYLQPDLEQTCWILHLWPSAISTASSTSVLAVVKLHGVHAHAYG